MQTNKWDIPDSTILLPGSGFQRVASPGKTFRSHIAKQNKQIYRKLHTAIGSLARYNQKQINGQGSRIIHYVITCQDQGAIHYQC